MTRIYLLSILLGILPISELRGAIPYAYLNGVPIWLSYIIGVLSNAMVPFIGFLFFETLHKLLDKWGFYHRLFEKTVDRARKKVGDKVSKYGLLGLMLFVAIPLPVTGAWTGILGAWVLGPPEICQSTAILNYLITAVNLYCRQKENKGTNY